MQSIRVSNIFLSKT